MTTAMDDKARTAAPTRNTIQRALVLEAVRSLHTLNPMSSDVYDVVREKYPNISRVMVYRNLGVLAKKGEVLRVEVPNGADRYDFRNKPTTMPAAACAAASSTSRRRASTTSFRG